MLKLSLCHSRSVTSIKIKIHYHFIFNHLFLNLFVQTVCFVCYLGGTKKHFITKINEYLQKDPKFKHLQESRICNSMCNKDCFSVIDSATTEYQLKMKEAMHIKWIQSKLHKQVKHYTLPLIV